MVRTLDCGPYTVELSASVSSQHIVYTVMDLTEAQAVWPLLKEPKPALAAISGADWNRELSPWPAPKAFRGGGDFGGDGPAFLDILTGQIVPMTEAQLGFAPVSRAVTGCLRGCLRCGLHFKQMCLIGPPPFLGCCGLTDSWTM